jgi:hypothetical protein
MKVLSVFAGVAVLVAACGGGGSARPTSTASPATLAAGTPAVTATGSSATPQPDGNDRLPDEDKAAAAAREIFSAEIGSSCPAGVVCASAQNSRETLVGGISVWNVKDASGDGFAGILGRTPDGEWKFWFRAQQSYQLITLPGDVRVCANGDGLRLRTTASKTAPPLASLADNAIITVDQFVLTEPGTQTGTSMTAGYGWYHTKTNPEGWAYSKYLSTALLPDCSLHDALEKP